MLKPLCMAAITIMILALPYTLHAEITVVAEPGTPQAMLDEVKTGMAIFNDVISEKYKYRQNGNVKLYVCPTMQSFAKVLNRIDPTRYPKGSAMKASADFVGVAIYNVPAVVLNFGKVHPESLQNMSGTIGHELFHIIQSEIGGQGGYVPPWIAEGTAGYAGALVAARRGVIDFEMWKWSEFRLYKKHPDAIPIKELYAADGAKWTRSLAHGMPYQVADLMTICFLQSAGNKGETAIIEYLRLAAELKSHEKAFTRVTSLTGDQFIARCDELIEKNESAVIVKGNLYKLRNIETGRYLCENQGKLVYGDGKGNQYLWVTEPVADPYVRIRNAQSGNYMHIQKKLGHVEVDDTSIPTWWSAQWELAKSDGDAYEIKNHWVDGAKIHCANDRGFAEYKSPPVTGRSLWTVEYILPSPP